MALEAIIIILIVGAIAGWLAGLIVKGVGFGLLGNIVVGIVGSFIAGWLLPGIIPISRDSWIDYQRHHRCRDLAGDHRIDQTRLKSS